MGDALFHISKRLISLKFGTQHWEIGQSLKFDILFNIFLVLDVLNIDLFADVSEEGRQLIEELLVFADNSERHDGLLNRHVLLFPQFPGSLDNAHNFAHLFADLQVDHLLVDFGDEEVVDGLLQKFAFGAENQAHILIHHVGDIGDHWAHQYVYFEENVKKNVDAHLHVDVINFTLDPIPVEADVPVC